MTVEMLSIAATSSGSARAISAITSPRRRRWRPGATSPRPSDFNASATWPCAICSAGRMPNTSDAATPHAIVIAMTGPSTPRRFQPAMNRTMRPGMNARMTLRNAYAMPSARGIAATASSTLSSRDSRTIRARLEPSASRMAISRPRSAPRASSKLAMLAQAINSTNTPAACQRARIGGNPTSIMPPPSV